MSGMYGARPSSRASRTSASVNSRKRTNPWAGGSVIGPFLSVAGGMVRFMRELIVTENSTIDGVVELAGDWFSPGDTDPDVDQSDVLATLREQRENADALLLGRVTFEDMRGYWPKQTEDTTGISAYLDSVSKYVLSSTLTEPEWENTTVLSGELRSEIERLKAAEGRDIVTTGSISLVRALIAEGLVDEYRLFVYPVVIGEGRRLFEGATGVPKLRLVEERPFASGIVLLRYRAASS